jgi:hypothetical protein
LYSVSGGSDPWDFENPRDLSGFGSIVALMSQFSKVSEKAFIPVENVQLIDLRCNRIGSLNRKRRGWGF